MKRIVFILLLFISLSSYTQTLQDTSYFKIEIIDDVAFLYPKLSQQPADTSRNSNGCFFWDEDYFEGIFVPRIDNLVKELGIYAQLMNEDVDFLFDFIS